MTEVEKLSVYDARIVQKAPAFAVDKGALSLTNTPFMAITKSASQMTFNVQVPSLNVFIDRRFEITTKCQVVTTVTLSAVTSDNQPLLVLGGNVALCAFPFHSCVSVMTATVNDCVSSINTQDVLTELLRLTDYAENRRQRTTPTYLDRYYRYADGNGASNNPLNGYTDAVDEDLVPNGAFYDVVFCNPFDGSPINPSFSGILNNSSTDPTLRYSVVNGVPIYLTSTSTSLVYQIGIQFRTTEKVVLSPFVFAEQYSDEVGLYGVNNIQFVFNLQQPSKVLRNSPSGSSGVAQTFTISNTQFIQTGGGPFKEATLNVQFLTPSLDLSLPTRNVLPYLEYPRYISSPGVSIGPGLSAPMASQTITLPQVPDMIIIYARPSTGSITTPQYGDFYLPITSLSINFDNFAGILSSQTAPQLYAMSQRNGLMMNWCEWSGQGARNNATPSAPTTAGVSAYNLPLVGGFLVLKPGRDITLQAGLAPSVVGNYTFQISNATVFNQTPETLTPQLYVVTVNSGYFETQSGMSRIIKGVLTESDVISAPMASMGSRESMERLVGAGFLGKLAPALSSALSMLGRPEVRGAIKEGVRSLGGERGRMLAGLADKVGLGAPAGSGRPTGGRARLSALM